MEELAARNFQVVNVDIVIITQAPKIAPYRERIQSSVSTLLETTPDSVNVKATTTDHMGFLGRGEGIAAQAVVLLKQHGA
ncbi:MAG: 2-C-methyl-D-erythritol 2,4-cyclodiphosphate synthase, partial [Anaerolineae bacterium]|nr:2-C-methyl-D-erythritol 2,4-cyclodiphosphate synthase [Anaerolineae bacterium]